MRRSLRRRWGIEGSTSSTSRAGQTCPGLESISRRFRSGIPELKQAYFICDFLALLLRD
jgi:hypothetical protein